MKMLESFGDEGREAIEWIRSGCRMPRCRLGIDRSVGTKKGRFEPLPQKQETAF